MSPNGRFPLLLLRISSLVLMLILTSAVGWLAFHQLTQPTSDQSHPLIRLALHENGRLTHPLPLSPTLPLRIETTAVLDHPNKDILLGVTLVGDPPVTIQLSPLGYAGVESGGVRLPLQPWPHVRPQENEIWIAVSTAETAVWLNRERLWLGPPVTNLTSATLFVASETGATAVTFLTDP